MCNYRGGDEVQDDTGAASGTLCYKIWILAVQPRGWSWNGPQTTPDIVAHQLGNS